MTTASQGMTPLLLLGPAMPCGGAIGFDRTKLWSAQGSPTFSLQPLAVDNLIHYDTSMFLAGPRAPYVPSMDFLPHTDYVGFTL